MVDGMLQANLIVFVNDLNSTGRNKRAVWDLPRIFLPYLFPLLIISNNTLNIVIEVHFELY
jgi:hypothetical protein